MRSSTTDEPDAAVAKAIAVRSGVDPAVAHFAKTSLLELLQQSSEIANLLPGDSDGTEFDCGVS